MFLFTGGITTVLFSALTTTVLLPTGKGNITTALLLSKLLAISAKLKVSPVTVGNFLANVALTLPKDNSTGHDIVGTMLAITEAIEGIILLTFELALVVPAEVFETCVVKVVVALPCAVVLLVLNNPATELNAKSIETDATIEDMLVVLSNPERVALAPLAVVGEETPVVAETLAKINVPSVEKTGGLTERLTPIEARVVKSFGPWKPVSARGAADIGCKPNIPYLSPYPSGTVGHVTFCGKPDCFVMSSNAFL